MAETAEDTTKTQTNKKTSKKAEKLNYDTIYEQISKENPILEENKTFWARKGNSQKYTCTLCNIGVQVSLNLLAFKSAILAHVEDKYHKKRYDSFIAKENTSTIACLSKTVDINTRQNKQSAGVDKDKNNILGSSEYKEEVMSCKEKILSRKEKMKLKEQFNDEKNLANQSLVDFHLIYGTFEKVNPVVKTSKQFIVKTENGRDFYCNLCKVLIFNPINASEFRYNLWVHLNDESHRERLPNFSEVEEHFEETMSDLSKALPISYQNELKYFEFGPVFRFVKCSLCDIAVSTNLHRLENHLKSEDHVKNKKSVLKGKSTKTESLSDRTRNGFRKLVVQLDDQFRKDIKYIQIGKMPGYAVCSLCTYVILPTKFYMETHLTSAAHVGNKKKNLVNRNSKFKIGLKDLMNTLPDDLREYDIFVETFRGLICKKCHTTIPPTSYDLYTHIVKERLACLQE